MPGTGTGLDGQLGFAVEGSYGSGGTPTRFFEFNSEGLKRQKTTVQGTGLRAGGRVARVQRRLVTTRAAAGPIAGDFVNSGMGMLVANVTGVSTSTPGTATTLAAGASAAATTVSVTGLVTAGQNLTIDVGALQEVRSAISVTGAGPYTVTVAALTNTHSNGAAVLVNGGPTVYTQVHTIGSLLGKSLVAQKGVPSTATGVVEPFTYLGCKFTDMDVTISKGGLAQVSFGVDAMDEQTLGSTPAGPALAVASYPSTSVPFSFLGATLSLGGSPVAGVTKANVKLNRAQKLDRFYLGGSGLKAEPLENAWQAIDGGLDADFVSRAALYDSFASDATLSLALSFAGPVIGTTGIASSLTISVPAIKLNGDTPVLSGPDIVPIVCPYVGLDNGVNPPVTYTIVTADTAL